MLSAAAATVLAVVVVAEVAGGAVLARLRGATILIVLGPAVVGDLPTGG
ncbi:hypothetical protein [Streptomyces sp. VNUA24]|nr:hypothetical protein [Streptomyces sp. VNUA24]WEH12471.1 hypothetical protein PYR72_01680 [Streptomyces sp. VNUA24]